MVDKKKISIIGGSFILVAAVVACVVVLVVNNNGHTETAPAASHGPMTSVKSIQSICQPTDYPKTCEEALTKEAGNATDIKSLVKASFQVALNHLTEAGSRSTVLSAAAKDPDTSGALETCKTLFDYAVHDLQEAIDNILGYDISDLSNAVYDVKNWLSAANTYQWTCLDEFKDKSSDAAASMKKALNTSMELTSNALAIVDQFSTVATGFGLSSILGGSGNRRLLADSEGHPTWLSQSRRRLLQLSPWQLKPLVVVAQDGSGDFKTITEGLAHMPRHNKEFVVMYIKQGIYNEKVLVERSLNKLVIIGDGPTNTRVTGNLNVMMPGMGTFRTASFSVVGDEFMAKDIGFENTAGPQNHQAVALRSQSDRSVFYNCHFDAYQDTLYAHTKRQFYRECTISGTVDFIFGDSSSIFQNCKMIVRKPMANQQNIVTAHGSPNSHESTAFIIHNCTIVPEAALAPVAAQFPSYLGRPWKPFARTIYIQSEIDGFIHPDGWMPWQGAANSSTTCYYAEIDNRGAGSDKSKRVKWPGVYELTLADADKYTVEKYFGEPEWPKSTTVPYTAGLLASTH